MRIAVQTDPVETLNQHLDSSLELIRTALSRDFDIWTFQPHQLWRDQTSVHALAHTTTLSENGRIGLGQNSIKLDLARDVDVVLIRQDPPVNALYRTSAHLLSLLHKDTLVLNNPDGILTSPEKILPLEYPELIPPTLLTRDRKKLQTFRSQHGSIVLKPLHGHGGTGIFLIKPDQINFDAALDALLAMSPYPVIAQTYLNAVQKGDKRIILIAGIPVGAINRRPSIGSIRANMAVGGTAEKAELSDADTLICSRIGPQLRQRGLTLVGIDVIGGKLTEINVTSPTGLIPLRDLCGIDAASLFWDHVENIAQT